MIHDHLELTTIWRQRYNTMYKGLRGTELEVIFIGFMVFTYFNVTVTWTSSGTTC